MTPLTQRALEKATELHAGQVRKGASAIPYIVHPVIAASFVARFSDDEEVVAAALLHDVLEDTPYTREELARDFGERIAKLVSAVTVPKSPDGWRAYLQQLEAGSLETTLIASGDKIHNFTTITSQFGADHEQFRAYFTGAQKSRFLAYAALVSVLRKKLEGHPAREVLMRAWEPYEQLLQSLEDEVAVARPLTSTR